MIQIFEHPEVLSTWAGVLPFILLLVFLLTTVLFGLSMIHGVTKYEYNHPVEVLVRIGLGVSVITVAVFLVWTSGQKDRALEANLLHFEEYYDVDIIENMSSIPNTEEPQGLFLLVENDNPDMVISCNVSIVDESYEFICTDTASIVKELVPAD